MTSTARHISNLQSVHWVAYHDAPLSYLAKLVINEQSSTLPDLTGTHIIVPETWTAAELRHHLLTEAANAGFNALLGAKIETLSDWAYRHLPEDIQLCDAQSQELILIEALNQYPELLRSASPWVMAENLLSLFAELTLKHVSLPASPEDFIKQLEQAYGQSSHNFDALGLEANLIHTLWQAWHTQLQAEGLCDTHTAYLHGLSHSLKTLDADQTIYLAGIHQLNPAEIHWFNTLVERNQVRLILHGNSQSAGRPYHPDAPMLKLCQQLSLKPVNTSSQIYTHFIDEVFNTGSLPLNQRATEFCSRNSESPATKHLGVYSANNAEQEAKAIDLQIRRWLGNKTSTKQIKRIGIVTENRRLARRVRALLERSHIPIEDASGWALSTTSAAATIERWLECIEEDFDHLTLLDLLKSPFLFPEQNRDELKHAIYRFEQDIVRHENVSRGLEQYQHFLQVRRERLSSWPTHTYSLLQTLLNKLSEVAQPLQQLLSDKQKQPASRYLQCFIASLKHLGVYSEFEQDSAGQRLQQAFNELAQASQTIELPLNWIEFRTWLGRHLERVNFQPGRNNSPVQLMGLAQSRMLQFDALIIAGVEQEYLPGRVNISPFFNDSVCKELGLSTATEQLSERLYHFRRLLESAPKILITLRQEEHGEPVSPSPWLEALQAFHQHAYGERLSAPILTALMGQQDYVVEDKEPSLPRITERAMPQINSGDLPGRYSSTAYQKLMNCPYQFFASYCLKLKPPEEVSEALARDEYGRKIHLCLQAFHTNISELPGPFTEKLDTSMREQAIKLMNNIATTVFLQYEEERFEYQAWLQQWQNIIPYYIDWEISRQQHWSVLKTEQYGENQLEDSVSLKGRLDRIDINQKQQLAIIDYKTGNIPKEDEVLQGEYVQLPFYALLDTDNTARIDEVAYLQLNEAKKIRVKVSLEKEELDSLKQAIALRLQDIIKMLKAGHALPAWGDIDTCRYCDMDKLCRRQAWQDSV